MKKIIVPAIALALLASCGAKNTGNQPNADSTKVETKVSNAVTTSPDLVFYSLQGPVKRVICQGDTVDFDQKGKISKIKGRDPFAEGYPTREFDDSGSYKEYCGMKRNEKGQIVEETWIEGVTYYVWEGEKMVADSGFSECYEWHSTYDLDENGRIAKISTYSFSEPGQEVPLRNENTIKYSDFDSHNNWTKRSGSLDDVEVSRTIEYWE